MLTAAAMGFALIAPGPTHAMDMMKCDDASMMKMQTDMDAMNDPAMKMNKDMAMKEMDMAKMAMKDKKMDECSTHLTMANMSMMMKCDDASMMKMDEMIKADTDPAMKKGVDMATKEMDQAKMAMKDSKTDDCMMHMGEAMKSMSTKM